MKIHDTERALFRFCSEVKKKLAVSGIDGWCKRVAPADGLPYVMIFGEYAERLERERVYVDRAFLEEIWAGGVRRLADRLTVPLRVRLGFTYGIDIVDPSGAVIHTVPYLTAAVMHELNEKITVIRNTDAINFKLYHPVYRFNVRGKLPSGEYRILLRNGQNVLESRTYEVGIP